MITENRDNLIKRLNNILAFHLKTSRKIAKSILKTYPLKSSGVIISHKIILKDGRSSVISEIELTGTRFYKYGADKIIDDENMIKEFMEKDYD